MGRPGALNWDYLAQPYGPGESPKARRIPTDQGKEGTVATWSSSEEDGPPR